MEEAQPEQHRWQRYLSIISICRSQQLSLILLMADVRMIIPIGRMYLQPPISLILILISKSVLTELTGRTSGVFIQGVQGHKWIEETVYRPESIFKGKRRL